MRWIVGLFLITGLSACAFLPSLRPDRQLVAMSWNVQNLFDEVADGGEYPEFDPQRGWTREQFWCRCQALATVIRSAAPSGPDILALQEIENAHTLESLNQRFLLDLGYQWSAITPATSPGPALAILSRFPLVRTGLLCPLAPEGSQELRPLLEAEWDLGGRRLVVINNHWKSRIPSPEATEAARGAASSLLAQRLAELAARPDRPLVLAVGDFNTSLELSQNQVEPAFVGLAEAASGRLRVTLSRASAQRSEQTAIVFDPWKEAEPPQGSYWHAGQWNALDHVLIVQTALTLPDWQVGDFAPVRFAPLPRPWSARDPHGISDHFPVLVVLRRLSP